MSDGFTKQERDMLREDVIRKDAEIASLRDEVERLNDCHGKTCGACVACSIELIHDALARAEQAEEEVERLNESLGVESRRADDREKFLKRAVMAEAEVERLKGVEKLFGEIMAVMHRDGGHYYCEHGVKKASNDAKQIYYDLRARLEQAEARVEKVRDLIEESEEVPHLEITSGNVAKMLKEILK